MRFIFTALVLTALILPACNRPPEPCIEIDPATVSTGVTVTFTSCSKHTLSLEWFMDGPAGAPENTKGWSDPVITNVFTVPGAYTITLNCYSKYSYIGEMRSTTTTLTVQ